MSRTTRTLPKWIQRQIMHTNNLVNGYRGLQYYSFCADCIPCATSPTGMAGSKVWYSRLKRHDVAQNERGSIEYSTDNGKRSLKNCKNSLPIGKACGWNMCEATGQDAKKFVRKLWARANRRWSAQIVKEELELMEYDDEDDRLMQEETANEYYNSCDSEYYWDMMEDDDMGEDPAYRRGYEDGYKAALRAFQREYGVAC